MTINKLSITAITLLLSLALPGCFFRSASSSRNSPFRSTAANTPAPVRPVDAQAVELTELGDALIANGNLSNALIAFERALERDPTLTDAHVGVGDVYQEKGDYNTAAKNYHNATLINPNHFPANYKLGLMYHLLNRLPDAITSYLNALTLNPNSFEANFNLATAYLQTKQTTLALPYAERAINIGAENTEPESLQAAFANLGAIYSSLGRHEDAIQAYLNAADQGDLPAPLAINLVNALIKTGELQRALDTLSVLVVIEKKPEYYERIGYINFKLALYDASLSAYDNALAINPNDTSALNGIGVNLMTRYLQDERNNPAQRNQAVQAWRQSMSINPNQPKILNLITRYSKL